MYQNTSFFHNHRLLSAWFFLGSGRRFHDRKNLLGGRLILEVEGGVILHKLFSASSESSLRTGSWCHTSEWVSNSANFCRKCPTGFLGGELICSARRILRPRRHTALSRLLRAQAALSLCWKISWRAGGYFTFRDAVRIQHELVDYIGVSDHGNLLCALANLFNYKFQVHLIA